jgi:lipopolysaccharide export system protein LptC
MGSGMSALAAVSDVNQGRPKGLMRVRRRPDDERAFRAAVRHSRHIRILRVAIPAGVALILLGAIAATWLSGPLAMLSRLPGVDIGSLVVSGTKIMMQQPKISGFTRDNRRYDMTAQAAGQDLTKPDLIELHGVHAVMEMRDKAVFDTTAKDGLYNSKTDSLTLYQDIVVTSSSGYRVLLSEAAVDVKAGKVVSEKPVEVTTSSLTINANRMEVVDAGDVMRFERGVTVLMMPEATGSSRASAEVRKR